MRLEEVRETFQGETAWEGEVGVFRVEHPDAEFVYAWPYTNNDGQPRAVTVLGQGPIDSPANAVRAYIVSVIRRLLPQCGAGHPWPCSYSWPPAVGGWVAALAPSLSLG
ncbi:hypothetical protein IIA16_01470 [bacterium]|nr:hypothetical protein [bacterium]